MTARKIELASGSCDQREGTFGSRTSCAGNPVRTQSVSSDQLSASRSDQKTTAGQTDWGASFRSGLPKAVRRKCSGVVSSVTPILARARSRRYSACGIGLALFGQVGNAANFIPKRIGNAKTCGRAKYAAAGIGHRHFHQPLILDDIANAAIGFRHESPQSPQFPREE